MALSGNLGFVPLDEVLRLLARAGQKGAVEVRGQDVNGRIFVTSKGITLATTSDDSSLRSHLLNSGFVDENVIRNIESGSATLESVVEKKSGLTDLIREMTVESIFQLSANGSSFEVDESATSPYSSPKAFDLESILGDAQARGDEWSRVEAALADLSSVLRMRRDLGERDEVTISRDAWTLLSEVGSGSTIGEIAIRLGTTEFWTAKVVAEMASRDLIAFAGVIAQEPAAAPSIPVDEPWAPSPADEPVAVRPDHDDEDVDPNQSWWVEPKEEQPDQEVSHSTFATSPEPEETGRTGRLGMFALNRNDARMDDEDGHGNEPESAFDEVEQDTEAFLEKVFSELGDSDGDSEPEAQSDSDPESEGHGLLRRRRIGSMMQDSDD